MSGQLDQDALVQAGLVNARTHETVHRALSAGVTGRELDAVAAAEIRRHGAIASFPETAGFPSTICLSVNDVIGHGVPGDCAIGRGDLVKVDIGVGVDGVHTDCARTYLIDRESDDVLAISSDSPHHDLVTELITTTEAALWAGIAAAETGRRASDISYAIASVIRGTPFSLFRHAFGHGVGETLHESPQLANFGPPNMGPRLRIGQVLAIEPVVVTGRPYRQNNDDAWNHRTVDGGLAAHFEDTVLITKDGPYVVTREKSAESCLSKWSGITAFPRLEGITARAKRADDDVWILEMARAEMNEVLIEAWGRAVDPQEVLRPERAETIVLERIDGTPVGFLTLRLEASVIHLVTIVIGERFQGLGIGSKVMVWLEQRAKSLRARRVQLWVQTTNTRAVQFYEKLGYEVFATPYVSTLAMRKSVSTA